MLNQLGRCVHETLGDARTAREALQWGADNGDASAQCRCRVDAHARAD